MIKLDFFDSLKFQILENAPYNGDDFNLIIHVNICIFRLLDNQLHM